MARKLSFVTGLGVGYMLGTRSGRARYEQISARVQELWHDPRVQDTLGRVWQVTKDRAGQAQQAVQHSAGSGASARGGRPS